MHARENTAVLKLLNADIDPISEADYLGHNFATGKFNLTKTVESGFGDAIVPDKEVALKRYACESGLDKHDVFI